MAGSIKLILAVVLVTGCGSALGPQPLCTLNESKEWVCNGPPPRSDAEPVVGAVAPARIPHGVHVSVPSRGVTLTAS